MSKRLNNADVGMLFADLSNVPIINMEEIATMLFRAVRTFGVPIIENGQLKTYGVINENLEPKAEGKQ